VADDGSAEERIHAGNNRVDVLVNCLEPLERDPLVSEESLKLPKSFAKANVYIFHFGRHAELEDDGPVLELPVALNLELELVGQSRRVDRLDMYLLGASAAS
jgi:hypothetical protein